VTFEAILRRLAHGGGFVRLTLIVPTIKPPRTVISSLVPSLISGELLIPREGHDVSLRVLWAVGLMASLPEPSLGQMLEPSTVRDVDVAIQALALTS
jgi:hypothetical protein